MHALVAYQIVSLFSMRAISHNSLAARTLPCPTPAALKLGILSALLRRDGPEPAQEHLEWLAPLGVAWRPPERLALTSMTTRMYKSATGNEPLTMTAGVREWVHAATPFGIVLLDVPPEREPLAEYGLSALRALGSADSLVQPLHPPEWVQELPEGFVVLTGANAGQGEVAVVVDDLGSSPSFERVSAYREVGPNHLPRLGEDRRRILVTLPLRATRRSTTGSVLETER